MRDISFLVSPIPDHAFFEQPVLQHLLGQRLPEVARLGTQCAFTSLRGRLAGGVAGKALLAGLQELLRPTV